MTANFIIKQLSTGYSIFLCDPQLKKPLKSNAASITSSPN